MQRVYNESRREEGSIMGCGSHHMHGHRQRSQSYGGEQPRDSWSEILKQRLVRGEITTEEYRRMAEVLRGDSQSGPLGDEMDDLGPVQL